MSEVEVALQELANQFDMAGGAWSGREVAAAIRRYLADRDVILSNRKDDD